MAVVLPARFVSPITPESITELSIPPDFTHKLLNLEAEARVRRVDTRRVWTVEVMPCLDVRGKKHYKLIEGWVQLIQENGIILGDYLVIEYSGNSVFTITVYAPTGVARVLPLEANPQAGPSNVRGRRPAYVADNESAIAGTTYLAYSRFPNFIVVLTSGYIQTSKPNVALAFAVKYLSNEDGIDIYATILVKGAEYPVIFSNTYNCRGRITSCQIKDGFKEVIRGARLRKGQVLAFEMFEVIVPLKRFKITVFGNP